jgi:hypothetical protein
MSLVEYLNLAYCVGLCRTARVNLFGFNFLYPTSIIDKDLEKRHKIVDNCTELLLYKMSTYAFYLYLGTPRPYLKIDIHSSTSNLSASRIRISFDEEILIVLIRRNSAISINSKNICKTSTCFPPHHLSIFMLRWVQNSNSSS